MNPRVSIIAALMFVCVRCRAGETIASLQNQVPQPDLGVSAREENESKRRADKRYVEMLDKMRAAVEEIAQLYGNPLFLQVFTNDSERVSELKQRLKAAQTGDDIRRELAELAKRRDDLLNDIALKEREATKLADRLIRQRVALDSLATAMDKARKAVEDTAR